MGEREGKSLDHTIGWGLTPTEDSAGSYLYFLMLNCILVMLECDQVFGSSVYAQMSTISKMPIIMM